MLIEEDREIDIFVGSKIGSFKHIKYHTDSSKNNKKCIENLVDVKTLQKDDGITCMVWGNEEETDILIGKQNQQIQFYNTLQGFTKTLTADFGTGHVVGLGRHKRKVIAGLSDGVVKIWSKKSEQIVQAGKMDRLKVCADDSTLFATGGEENDLKVWRIGEAEPTFAAKNLANDWLQLRRPVWVSDLTFLPGEGGNLIAACSRHGYVRLYDTRAQRRPVCNIEFPMAATCIANSFDEKLVLVGFARGQLHQVDLRNQRPDKGFKGCAGAVTHAAASRASGLVISAGLDRTLRAHRFDDKRLVYKQYLTSKLSCFLIQSASSTPLRRADAQVKEEDGEEPVDVDEMDQLFEDMETVGEKHKTKTPEEPESKKQKVQPSTEGSTDVDPIFNLLRSTEKQKKKREKQKKEKKAKSVFHNA